MVEDEIQVKQDANGKLTIAWNLPKSKQEFVELYFGKPFKTFVNAIRLYDVTGLFFNGNNALTEHEILIPSKVRSWKVKGLKANRRYCVEVGIKLTEFEFFPLIRSASVSILPFEKDEDDETGSTGFMRLPKNDSLSWQDSVSTYTYYEHRNSRRFEK